MSSSLLPLFLHWGEFTSQDEDHPDVLEIEPLELDTFETEYSINSRVKIGGEEKILPLHSFASRNKQLYTIWMKGVKEGKIKIGKKFKLNTWLGTSKNKLPIRRFDPIF